MSLLRFAVNGLNVTVVQVFHFARFIDRILDGIRWTFSRPYNLTHLVIIIVEFI